MITIDGIISTLGGCFVLFRVTGVRCRWCRCRYRRHLWPAAGAGGSMRFIHPPGPPPRGRGMCNERGARVLTKGCIQGTAFMVGRWTWLWFLGFEFFCCSDDVFGRCFFYRDRRCRCQLQSVLITRWCDAWGGPRRTSRPEHYQCQ